MGAAKGLADKFKRSRTVCSQGCCEHFGERTFCIGFISLRAQSEVVVALAYQASIRYIELAKFRSPSFPEFEERHTRDHRNRKNPSL